MTSSADLTEMGLRTRATPLLHAFRERLPFPHEMKDIQEHLGVEIATTVFSMALETVQPYAPFIRKVRSTSLATSAEMKAKAKNFEVMIVASNAYQSGRKWGDHVETWVSWARSMGFTTDWVPTDSKASVSENARILSRYLINHPHPNRIIVTYGQGSSELRTLMLNRLGERGRTEEARTALEFEGLRLWLNVCGGVGGIAANEIQLRSTMSRLRAVIDMKFRRRNSIVLEETRTTAANMRRLPNFPADLGVINVIGLPLRSQLPRGFAALYHDVSKSGPTDGVLSLFNMIAHPGLIVPIPAMAHTAPDFKLEPVLKRVLSVFLESASVRAAVAHDSKPLVVNETNRADTNRSAPVNASGLSLEQ
ncbi:MAG: hypothetical protein V4760_00540 [Bdellovibrionota bacterium]